MLQHLGTIWKYRHFWCSLVRMDLRTRYRRSVLGIGWSLLYPLAMTVVFFLVFRMLAPADRPDWWRTYLPQTLAGLAIWEFLRGTAVQGCRAFVIHESYIRQSPLPYSIYPLRIALSQLIHAGIALCVVAILVVAVKPGGIQLQALATIPGVLMLGIFAWALATFLAFVTAYFPDIAHIVELSAQALFFLTPVVYPKENLRELAWLADYNPLNAFLEIVRTPLVMGELPHWSVYIIASSTMIFTLGLASLTARALERRVVFHL